MKFFIAFFALAAVAVASPLHKPIDTFEAELSAIIAAINHPSTDPATASLLQEQLESIMTLVNPEPISVGPAIIDQTEYEPISVGPAIIEQVVPEVVESPILPPPVLVTPTPSGKPLVQLIININRVPQPTPVFPAPVLPTPVLPEPIQPSPVIVVEQPINVEPVLVAPIVIPEPAMVLPDILN